MKIKHVVGVFAVAMVCVAVLLAVYSGTYENGHGVEPRDYTDREVVVFSDDDFINNAGHILDDSKSTKYVYPFYSWAPTDGTIVMIDCDWLAGGEDRAPSMDNIRDMVDSGRPLIFLNNGPDSYRYTGFDFGNILAYAYGIYIDGDGVHRFYIYNGDSLNEALIDGYSWADKTSFGGTASA